jgi:homoserine O-succinyltransferase/O-acetyltransferase
MPINISDRLPAAKILEEENIFFLKQSKANRQDIRPLKILILNLMPDKITTETQLLRLVGNTPIQTEVTLIHPKTYVSKNTSKDHLVSFYKHFDNVKNKKFDGMIITGAPVETMEFEDVDYWEELCEIMKWSKKNVTSTMHICWASQAALYYHYGIKKYPTEEKIFGVFEHKKPIHPYKLLRGFDDIFYAPHSRHTEIRSKDIKKIPGLEIIADSKDSGIYIIKSKNGKQFFITGHSEYDPLTLKKEYDRDIKKGKKINVPRNYFPGDDPTKRPIVLWRAHSHLLFANWMNYYVYQSTPFGWTKRIKKFIKSKKRKIKAMKK